MESEQKLIASVQMPERGRVNEPRFAHVLTRENGSFEMVLEIDPTNFEDMVGPEAYAKYLLFVSARRGLRFPPAYEKYLEEPEPQSRIQKILGKLGLR